MEREVYPFLQTEEIIKRAVAKIRKIQKIAIARYPDPVVRLDFYVDFLDANVEYDKGSVMKFYEHMTKNKMSNFKYSDYMNTSRLFLENVGACQQFSVALAMLCYDDPDIECYQLVVEKGKKRRVPQNSNEEFITRYKHSANYVKIPKISIEGVVDPVNNFSFPSIMSLAKYKEVVLERFSSVKLAGMAYYKPGLHLEAIYMIMQSFGTGIKFDFDSYEAGRKSFLESFNQERLNKMIEYQTRAEGDLTVQDNEKKNPILSFFRRKR